MLVKNLPVYDLRLSLSLFSVKREKALIDTVHAVDLWNEKTKLHICNTRNNLNGS